MSTENEETLFRAERHAALLRSADPAFARWAAGKGPIRHGATVQLAVHALAARLVAGGLAADVATVYRRFDAADTLASAGMWLVAHMTYARRVRLDGAPLAAEDFKSAPEGHTGGSLNIAVAYAGYLAANALTGHTRAWLMGQGHCVAGVDALNVLAGNMGAAHAARYDVSDAGLSRLAQDFYSYETDQHGRPASPLGSHVNAHTAGALIEGGYLGFAELQYVHLPLPGERLVAFLSDGAFEEQRGSDWMARWWRPDDCGLAVPVMIANGRRIDQKTSMGRPDGVAWFDAHLRLNGFAPVLIDGRDPAAYACAVIDAEERLQATADALAAGRTRLPVPLPYVIAVTDKGWGFPGAGTQAAHNLPLGANPATDADARALFNAGAALIWQSRAAIEDARAALATHETQGRPAERDHPLARRDVPCPALPHTRLPAGPLSPMDALDLAFCDIVDANPGLRVRVGNPDEMRSNRLCRTLDKLKHRVLAPEPGIAESLDGAVVTALNEEAVVCAAIANKGGLALVASYEAFAVKMLGALRQDIIFARHLREAGQATGWRSLPVISTSHTWENGKNEQSHQDPALAEALMGEMADSCRVLYPVDADSAVAALHACYASSGRIYHLVVPKRVHARVLDAEAAREAVAQGWAVVQSVGDAPKALQLIAVGAPQLRECLAASAALSMQGVAHEVVALIEPARLQDGRDEAERAYCVPPAAREAAFPAGATRVLCGHTRAHTLTGLLWPIANSAGAWHALGYLNAGGTLDEAGMLAANRCDKAAILAALGRSQDGAPLC